MIPAGLKWGYLLRLHLSYEVFTRPYLAIFAFNVINAHSARSAVTLGVNRSVKELQLSVYSKVTIS